MATDQINREFRIAAKPETVFPFLVDSDLHTKWMGKSTKLDPVAGGAYRVEVNDNHVATGEFVEVVPNEKVVFTWGWEGGEPIAPGSTTVEITLTADGDGTILRFQHRGLPEEAVAPHTEGWDHFLPRLETAGSGGDPGLDPWAEAS